MEAMEEKQADGRNVPIDETRSIEDGFKKLADAFGALMEQAIKLNDALYDMAKDCELIDANLDHLEKVEEMNRRERDALRWRNEASRSAAYTRRRRDPPIKKRFRRYQGRRKCGHR